MEEGGLCGFSLWLRVSVHPGRGFETLLASDNGERPYPVLAGLSRCEPLVKGTGRGLKAVHKYVKSSAEAHRFTCILCF